MCRRCSLYKVLDGSRKWWCEIRCCFSYSRPILNNRKKIEDATQAKPINHKTKRNQVSFAFNQFFDRLFFLLYSLLAACWFPYLFSGFISIATTLRTKGVKKESEQKQSAWYTYIRRVRLSLSLPNYNPLTDLHLLWYGLSNEIRIWLNLIELGLYKLWRNPCRSA